MHSSRRLRVLALEPWLAGSHAQFLDQWKRHSTHDVRVIGLAGRDWKWRMRAGAWELARAIEARGCEPPDVLWLSDYVDVSSLYGELPRDWSSVPCVVYFHENQISYPARAASADDAAHERSSSRDLHLAFTNVLSAVRADTLVFNSSFHKEDFARAAADFLGRLPRPNPRRELELAISRARVIAPGLDLDAIMLGPGAQHDSPLRVVFNHRWEHDKDPIGFLHAVRDVIARGLRMDLVLLGERFEALPSGAAALLEELAVHIVHRGFLPDRGAYAHALAHADLVVSTARQEFFGLAVAEAMAAGCNPLLPRRLAYPELVGADGENTRLYSDTPDLVTALERAARAPNTLRSSAARVANREAVRRHDARDIARALDAACTETRARIRRTPELQHGRGRC